jgi:ATP-dependent Clp protease protease subunit
MERRLKQQVKPNKFWRWTNAADTGETTAERVLYLDGTIAAESWYDDEVSPAMFKSELFSGSGDVTIWLNSPGGDVIAASQIYAMLMDYPGNVTVKIDGIAASAASVIAMAGTRVLMAPTALMMIHNPATIAIGDGDEMLRAKAMLDEVKEPIINAYELRTSMSRTQLAHMMTAETWMNARKAIELGFADALLDDAKRAAPFAETYAFSRQAVTNSLLDKLKIPRAPQGVTIASLDERLNLIGGIYHV